jgi:hypothetical protein
LIGLSPGEKVPNKKLENKNDNMQAVQSFDFLALHETKITSLG